jgi:hypothetical protein
MLRIASVLALLVTAVVAGLFVLVASSDTMFDHTIDNSKEILSQFRRAAAPGANTTGSGPYQVIQTPIEDAQCDDAQFQKNRKLAGDKVLLMIWRGEWMECYSSVSRTSTLTFDRNAYSVLGTLILDQIVFGAVCILSILAIVGVALRRPRTWFRPRSKPQPAP